MSIAQEKKRKRNPIGWLYVKVSLKLFKNVIGFRINLLHLLYKISIRMKLLFHSRHLKNSSTQISQLALKLEKNGFVKVGIILTEEENKMISEKVNQLINSPDKIMSSAKKGGLISLKNSFVEVSELEKILRHPKIMKILHHYYGSYYTLFHCSVYRIFPEDTDEAKKIFPSLIWHFDNLPPDYLKIFVYLTDSNKLTGALKLVPKPISSKLRERGYWDRYHPKYLDQISKNAVTIEGKAGTVIIFSSGKCIHKATLPKEKYRDTALFMVYPSPKILQPLTPTEREVYSHNYGYVINPFTKIPLRYGDE